MAKLTKEELINRINDLPLDDEMKISLMEDVTDSVEGEVISAEERVKIDGYDDIKFKYEDLVRKYKERFTSGVTEKEDIIEDAGDDLEEKEVIDVKEI